MKVKDLVLYQVATNKNYKVGDIVYFNSNTNTGQFDKVVNQIFFEKNERIADLAYMAIDGKCSKKQKLLFAKTLDNYDFVLRDLAMEFVRQKFYPNYPSRLHCMFLSETKVEMLKNLNERRKLDNTSNFQGIAVKLDGEIFRAGDVGQTRLGQSFAFYVNKAKEYWSQTNVENPVEILFEGKATIVEIF